MLSVLEHVTTSNSLHQQLLGQVAGCAEKDPTPVWLCLYEFEAKLFLGHLDLGEVLDKVASLASMEAKTLETMAALCMRTPPSGSRHSVIVTHMWFSFLFI